MQGIREVSKNSPLRFQFFSFRTIREMNVQPRFSSSHFSIPLVLFSIFSLHPCLNIQALIISKRTKYFSGLWSDHFWTFSNGLASGFSPVRSLALFIVWLSIIYFVWGVKALALPTALYTTIFPSFTFSSFFFTFHHILGTMKNSSTPISSTKRVQKESHKYVWRWYLYCQCRNCRLWNYRALLLCIWSSLLILLSRIDNIDIPDELRNGLNMLSILHRKSSFHLTIIELIETLKITATTMTTM